jgi:hypothetical protein
MLTINDLIHIPYTRDLTEGGIAYAVRSLPYTYNRMGGSSYERLRRIVAGVAVELAFRRYLAEREIPFDVKGATPFTDPDRYDVSLGGRRCDIKSFLITYREQISEMKRNPSVVLAAPALVPSDQHAAEGRSDHDIYLFAFLSGLIAASQADIQKVSAANQPLYLIHALPASWARPSKWTPLGRLVIKSEAEVPIALEIGGQDAGREMRSVIVEASPRTRIEVDEEFYSLAYVRAQTIPQARVGIRCATRTDTVLINPHDWGNIWVYGMDLLLTGWLTREEFSRRAQPIREGARVFQYDRTRTKNLAVPIFELKPLSHLFERVKEWNP